jgi:hypothetical protein
MSVDFALGQRDVALRVHDGRRVPVDPAEDVLLRAEVRQARRAAEAGARPEGENDL